MHIYKLADVRMHDLSKVGGKAASLGEMLSAGCRVPPGFVIAADAQKMTDHLSQEILQTFDDLKLNRVAVRSSGIKEDAKDESWAGQFDSFLNIERDGLIEAVQKCWQSAGSERVKAYGQAAKLAVLVQQMIEGDVSGVAFSINPVTKEHSQVMIEAVAGLCEALVQGLVTPDNYIINKATSKLLSLELTGDQPLLSAGQLKEVTKLVRSIEKYYGLPIDVEWTYKDGKLYLIQARPITTI